MPYISDHLVRILLVLDIEDHFQGLYAGKTPKLYQFEIGQVLTLTKSTIYLFTEILLKLGVFWAKSNNW